MKKSIGGKRLAWLLAYVYFASYVTRINFGAVIQEVVTDTGFEKSALSIILTCMSISYGLGQIINGRIGDRIKPQNLIFIGLISATVINALFPFFSASIPAMCVLWTLNGFAQAMMWPPIVKIMVSTMDEVTYSSATVIVSLGSSLGTIAVYLTAPVIISFFSWQVVLWASAAIGVVSLVIWMLVKDRAYVLPSDTDANVSNADTDKHFTLPKGVLFPLIFIALAIIFQGMLRDGVTNWMPSLLSDSFNFESSESILYTLSLAVFSMIAVIAAGAFYKKFFKNEVYCAAVIFATATVSCVLLTRLIDVSAVVTIVLMTLITGCAHGINLMLISHAPKRFRKYGNISTISGIINSCTYIGAAIATYGIAKLSELYGWSFTTLTWCIIGALGTVCCVIAIPRWKKFIEK